MESLNNSKTAITTSLELYEFLPLPFEMKNSTQCFQVFINHVLNDLNYVFVYIGSCTTYATFRNSFWAFPKILNDYKFNETFIRIKQHQRSLLRNYPFKNVSITWETKKTPFVSYRYLQGWGNFVSFVAGVNFYHSWISQGAESFHALIDGLPNKNNCDTRLSDTVLLAFNLIHTLLIQMIIFGSWCFLVCIRSCTPTTYWWWLENDFFLFI